MDGSRELKSKFHGLWELKQTFHESHKIQRLILFVAQAYSSAKLRCRLF